MIADAKILIPQEFTIVKPLFSPFKLKTTKHIQFGVHNEHMANYII